MPVPEFNEIKAPAMQFFADAKPHRLAEVFEVLAKHFNLTQDEQNELLPSGKQRRWNNRANWACYDLFRAGLLDRPKKGLYVITELGKKVAAEKPDFIGREYLMKFPSFAQFAEAKGKNSNEASVDEDETNGGEAVTSKTPEEIIEAAYRTLQTSLKSELLAIVKKMDAFRFEQLVLDLLVAMGYGGSREEAARVTKASGDEGVDGVINEDRLGLDVIYVQAKKWTDTTVGRPDIQSFVGALAGKQAQKGIFITTSDFADTAKAYAKSISQKVILIDGNRLADLMIEHNIGVAPAHAFELKRIDSDYFEEP
jgi:restriction system protein